MRVQLANLLAIHVFSSGIDYINSGHDLKARFTAWMDIFVVGAKYTDEQASAALITFAANDAHIQKVNSMQRGYILGHNKFSTMTSEAFRGQYTGLLSQREQYIGRLPTSPTFVTPTALPDSVDWVAQGAVTQVHTHTRMHTHTHTRTHAHVCSQRIQTTHDTTQHLPW